MLVALQKLSISQAQFEHKMPFTILSYVHMTCIIDMKLIRQQKDTGATKSKAAAQDTKTARIPQNELLDRIFNCFRRYAYWSMKALRAELQQPEAYLRETLDKVADMPKSGTFAMHWQLKPEFKNATMAGADDASAPTTAGALDGVDDSDLGDLDGEDDDDEDVKMEDVLPS
jgi:transcription initiation factor TFIIF subunit beta